MTARSAPQTVEELLARARELAGTTVGELGARHDVVIPPDQRRAKGLVGSLVERELGSDAASRAEPDFTGLGIELKTIPLDRQGRPRESTFVCTIELPELGQAEWETSRLRHKLATVLWVPVESEPELPLPTRRIGSAVLWTLDGEDEACLRHDWTELVGMIASGRLEDVTAHLGQYLQVRPKAANAAARRASVDGEGAPMHTLPRGFYLRSAFTARIFRGMR